MTRLLLLRHGQSEWNAQGRWQGWADPPLTDEGRDQARRAGRALGPFDAVVASTLHRAADTAAIIADVLGIGPVLTDPDLRERDAGQWQGLTRDEIEAGWPGALRDGVRPDGYEGDTSVLDRVHRALARVAGRAGDDGTVAVVTHGGVIYALEGACGEPLARIPNLGGRWIDWADGDLRLGARVDLLGDGTVPDLL
jgi:broad specificity phosphatase PhoE